MENKTIETMTRMEVIFELAKHAHADYFKSLMTWPTAHLKGLLQYYTEPRKEVVYGFDENFVAVWKHPNIGHVNIQIA